MYRIHALTASDTSSGSFDIKYGEISSVVACKPMWQNMRAYQTITSFKVDSSNTV
jgi:hypothetical protein